MSRKKRWFAMGRILPSIVAALVLCTGVEASGTYRAVLGLAGMGAGIPAAGLTFDAAGNLYGTTSDGGDSGQGAVFKLTPNGDGTWSGTLLHSFMGGTDGSDPIAGVVFDQAGNLYGTTTEGGGCTKFTFGCGTVFELTPQMDGSWTESIIHAFTGGADGEFPNRNPLTLNAGILYGEAQFGGAALGGVVFKLIQNPGGSWTEQVLYDFANPSGGALPDGGLVFDAAGNLYGTTTYLGNAHACGTVFKLAPNSSGTWSQSVLHTFCFSGSDGNDPIGGLTLDRAGNLYGVTHLGGGSKKCSEGCGTVFRLKRNSDGSWSYKKIHSFEATPALEPSAGVAVDAAGNVYGTTLSGGSTGNGVIFKLTPNSDGSWTEKTLHNFLGKPAAHPAGTLIFGEGGILYGTTRCCSANGGGQVFKFIP